MSTTRARSKKKDGTPRLDHCKDALLLRWGLQPLIRQDRNPQHTAKSDGRRKLNRKKNPKVLYLTSRGGRVAHTTTFPASTTVRAAGHEGSPHPQTALTAARCARTTVPASPTTNWTSAKLPQRHRRSYWSRRAPPGTTCTSAMRGCGPQHAAPQGRGAAAAPKNSAAGEAINSGWGESYRRRKIFSPVWIRRAAESF